MGKMRVDLTIDEYEFEGQKCRLDIKISPDDPSVGIFGPGIDDFALYGADGSELDLSDAQVEKIWADEALQKRIEEHYYNDDFC